MNIAMTLKRMPTVDMQISDIVPHLGELIMDATSNKLKVGDITLYTKLAYTYDEYVANSSIAGNVTAYFEDGSYGVDVGYMAVGSDGSILDVRFYNDYRYIQHNVGAKVYVFSTKKITSVDVNWGGGCGC